MSAQVMQSLAQQYRAAFESNKKFILPMMTAGQWAQFAELLVDF